MNSLFLPWNVWAFHCEDGTSWWAQKEPMLRAAKLYDSHSYQHLARAHIPEYTTVLSVPGVPHTSRFSLMYVKRVPVDSRW